MAVDFKLIGNRIKKKRKNLGKTQNDLAADLYVSSGYISQIERGITKVNLETLSEIADVLECDIAEFISMSNTHSSDVLKDNISLLYNKLSIEERHILLELLTTYLNHKNS